ncbi:MAG TPA: BlaI/MecI/CopY family transcriptional regulator [Vicinamibacteria bacterium]|nr:BlaI/MecI/CopY family transcriptional regulator [Vicinamibacteria bacterium]
MPPRPFHRLLSREGSLADAMLGPLECRVLEVVWSRAREWTVADVQEALGGLAYTTLLTTMDRMFKKGLLERRREGRAFVYLPRLSQDELERGIFALVVGKLLRRGRGAAEPVLSCLVDAVSDRDQELLGDLERLIRRKREKRERGEP